LCKPINLWTFHNAAGMENFSPIPYLRTALLCLLLLGVNSALVEAQQLSKSRRANQRYEAAMQAIALNQWNQATEQLKQVINADPQFPEAHQALGDIYRRDKQYAAAIIHYRQVTVTKPQLTPMTWF